MTWSIAWIFMATAPLLAQYTASDDCGFLAGNAYTVDPACIPRPFHKPAGANASFTPGTCNASTNADVFGWFEATGPSTTLNFAPNNGEDPALHVFTGSCGALTQVACANSPGPGSEDLVIPTVSGQTYLIRVQTTGSDNPMPDAQICIFATPPPPANDEPCTAMLLSADSACTNMVAASNSSATASLVLPDPGCFYTGEPDIWFAAVVPASGHLRVDTHANAMGPGDSGMALYTAEGCAQSMALIACNDDQSATDHMPSIDQTGLTPGDTIYIRFWAFYGGDGAFQVCASPNTSTLPVELISFNAVGAHGGIQLDWTTASETNSAHFTVERSSDALSFMPLIRMPAAGNSQGYRTYSFLDKTPPTGLNY
ncbi:MAG: hypothetical protein KBH07_00355 [Flavobacteriales bacterium]|nr:hypothetical protein [Flavobacteriales bacterium]MBP9079509.1 hypothetical protein [Flavobacteriales bacterium]